MKIPRPATLLALATLAALAVLSAASAQSGTTGKFTDKRDGQKYWTVKIGTQTWMAENLNYKTGKSVCYDNQESNCQKYGRLYDWNTARTVCPAGWHLPSDAEWTVLIDFVGGEDIAGKKLKAKFGWKDNGYSTDEYGFSALPGGGGRARWNDRDIGTTGYCGYWWSTTENDAYSVWSRYMNFYHDYVSRKKVYSKTARFSVRCVEDIAK